MGFLSKMTDSLILNSCTPEKLVGLMFPSNTVPPEAICTKAEARFNMLSKEVQVRALLNQLGNKDDRVRTVCAERLRYYVDGNSREITEALLNALGDSCPDVRFHVALYFSLGAMETQAVFGKLPFSPKIALQKIESAEKSEKDSLVKETLLEAIEFLGSQDI